MGGHQDAATAGAKLLQDLHDQQGSFRIQAGCWLVQDQEFRFGQKCCGQGEAALQAGAEFSQLPLRDSIESQLAENCLASGTELGPRQTHEAAEIIEELAGLELWKGERALRLIAHHRDELSIPSCPAENSRSPLRLSQPTAEDLEKSGLARSVWAEDAEDFSGTNLQIHADESLDGRATPAAGVTQVETFDLDRKFSWVHGEPCYLALLAIAQPMQSPNGFLELADGRQVELADNLTIGRVAGCDLVLDDKKVSRRHARVLVERGVVEIEDLGSSNGVWLNESAVKRRMLRDGDELRIGNSKMIFRLPREDPLPAEPIISAPVKPRSEAKVEVEEDVEVIEFIDETVKVRSRSLPKPKAMPGKKTGRTGRADRGVLQFSKEKASAGLLGDDLAQLGGLPKLLLYVLLLAACLGLAWLAMSLTRS